MWCLWCSARRSPDTNWSWVVCIAATLSNVIQFGFISCFGVFLPVLSSHFNEGKERTAWAGSFTFAISLCVGPFIVRMIERFGHRAVAMASGLMSVVSLISSSFANHLIILYFTHGVLYGISTGGILISCYTVITIYFKKKRALATGITASGMSIGIMSFGPIVEKLIELLGWRNTLRVVAGFMLLICVFASTYDPVQSESGEEQQQQARTAFFSFIDFTVFRNISYTIGVVSIAITCFGYPVTYIHLVRFAEDLNISCKDASFLFIYIGITSAVSRILTGQAIDKKWLTALQCVQLSSFILGISMIVLAFAKAYRQFVIFALVFGIGGGGIITSQNVFLQNILEPERSSIGLGMGCLTLTLPTVLGPPFAGLIADQLSSYVISFYIIAGMMIFSAAFPFILLCPRYRNVSLEDEYQDFLETTV